MFGDTHPLRTLSTSTTAGILSFSAFHHTSQNFMIVQECSQITYTRWSVDPSFRPRPRLVVSHVRLVAIANVVNIQYNRVRSNSLFCCQVAALDATVHIRMKNKFDIRGYPTIKMFPAGKKSFSDAVFYKGRHTTAGIVSWATKKLAAYVPAPENVCCKIILFTTECSSPELFRVSSAGGLPATRLQACANYANGQFPNKTTKNFRLGLEFFVSRPSLVVSINFANVGD